MKKISIAILILLTVLTFQVRDSAGQRLVDDIYSTQVFPNNSYSYCDKYKIIVVLPKELDSYLTITPKKTNTLSLVDPCSTPRESKLSDYLMPLKVNVPKVSVSVDVSTDIYQINLK